MSPKEVKDIQKVRAQDTYQTLSTKDLEDLQELCIGWWIVWFTLAEVRKSMQDERD